MGWMVRRRAFKLPGRGLGGLGFGGREVRGRTRRSSGKGGGGGVNGGLLFTAIMLSAKFFRELFEEFRFFLVGEIRFVK